TAAGAQALGLDDEVGDLSVGKQFDAVWLLPEAGDPLAVGLGNAKSPLDALSKVFALGTTSDVGGVWVAGDQIAASRWRMPPRR
ncbi:MAG TPA: amidohydrolase family protein, partial [Pedococcus sp.]|nr:amidohydrolase family protein [Pedococcus sp.]